MQYINKECKLLIHIKTLGLYHNLIESFLFNIIIYVASHLKLNNSIAIKLIKTAKYSIILKIKKLSPK